MITKKPVSALGRKPLLKIIEKEIASNRRLAQLIQRMDMGQRFVALLVTHHIEELRGKTGIVMPWQRAQLELLELIRDVISGKKPIPEKESPCNCCGAKTAIIDLPQHATKMPTVVCQACDAQIAAAQRALFTAPAERRAELLKLHQVNSLPDLAKVKRDTITAILQSLAQKKQPS